MNIFLLEDEPPILRDLKEIILSFGDTYHIVGQAMNGADALRQILDHIHEIDVVITDIQVPMISGLDVIRQVQGYSHKLKYIILSGYSDFNYAKKAIKIGVAEYLLKPVKEDELRQALEQISRENLKSYLKDGFYAPIKLEEKYYYCCVAILGAYRSNVEYENEYTDFLTEINPDKYWIINGSHANERYIIFPEEELEFCKATLFKMAEAGGNPVTILICQEHVRIYDVKKTIGYLCKRVGRYLILGKSQILMEDVFPTNDSQELLVKKLELVKARYSHSSLEEFKQSLLDWVSLAEKLQITQDAVMHNCYDILEHCLDGKHSIGIIDLLEEIMVFTYDFNTLFKNLYFLCMDAYRDGQENNRALTEMKGCFVSDITSYLYDNYMNNISIAKLGCYFHYSGSYISKIFREMKGISILEYLLMIRMNKAKELLKQPGFRVKDVSSMVGYEDSLYFSKVFKKREGMSPLEWQKQNNK